MIKAKALQLVKNHQLLNASDSNRQARLMEYYEEEILYVLVGMPLLLGIAVFCCKNLRSLLLNHWNQVWLLPPSCCNFRDLIAHKGFYVWDLSCCHHRIHDFTQSGTSIRYPLFLWFKSHIVFSSTFRCYYIGQSICSTGVIHAQARNVLFLVGCVLCVMSKFDNSMNLHLFVCILHQSTKANSI